MVPNKNILSYFSSSSWNSFNSRVNIIHNYRFNDAFYGTFFCCIRTRKNDGPTRLCRSVYDIIAKQSNLYSSIYPGIEFFLGVSYIFSYFLFNSAFVLVISFITFIVMTLGSIGILKNLFSKKPVQCACLGTKINLPLTKVTLLEDVIMSLMSLQLLRVILA